MRRKKTEDEKQQQRKQLSLAVDAVRRGQQLRLAAKMYGVPKSTLFDHVRTDGPRTQGAPTFLTAEEEADLAAWALRLNAINLTVTVDDVKARVGRILRSTGNERRC